MEFKSLDEIKEYFGIKDESFEEIRKKLIALLADNHPDKSGGAFSSPYRQKIYEEIDAAVKFVDGIKDEVTITNHDFSLILKKIEDLSVKVNQTPESVKPDSALERLDSKINSSIIQFQKRHLFPKISSVAILSLLTILWTFPEIVQGHLILKHFISLSNPLFAAVWFSSIIFTCFTWFILKKNENRDLLIKKSYSLESTQNNMFKLFLVWTELTNSSAVDFNTHRRVVRFTKDELINFLLNRYHAVERGFREYIHLDTVNMYLEINKKIEKNTILSLNNRRHEGSFSPLFFFSENPGEINIDLAQNIADSILSRLLSRKIIEVSKKQSFSETYEYTDLR